MLLRDQLSKQTQRQGKGIGSGDSVTKAIAQLAFRDRLRRRHMPRSKYNAKKTLVDGIIFDSKKEAARYVELKLLQKQGHIKNLERQVRVDVTHNATLLFFWKADFAYFENGKRIYEDVKGFETPLWRLKKKILKAMLNIHVRQT
jgi:hypothetical protein